jgi:hypothetical protein
MKRRPANASRSEGASSRDGRVGGERAERDQHAAERGAADPGELADRGRQRARADVPVGRHDRRKQRLFGREREGARDAGEHEERQDERQRRRAAPAEERDQRERDEDFREHPGGHDRTAVEAVRRDARERREHERRREQHEPHESEVEGAVADPVDLPRNRDALDLRGDVEGDEREQIQAESGVGHCLRRSVPATGLREKRHAP